MRTRLKSTKLVARMGLLWVLAGCGDGDGKDSTLGADTGPNEVADITDKEASESDGSVTQSEVALDASSNAVEAAKDLCRLAPWVLGKLDTRQLNPQRVTNEVRTDPDTFFGDKPPICIDDADSMEDLCNEMPTGTTTFTYLYRSEGKAHPDPVEQVWCKSDNFEDLALIPGAEGAMLGGCEDLHNVVVAWANARLDKPSSRAIRYEADLKERGSEWIPAVVQTTQDGTTLVVKSPELYAPTKVKYIADHGTDALPFLDDRFFGNHYCKLISPAAALAWLTGG